MNREDITRYIKHQTNVIVQSGPFAGMKLASDTSWGDGDLAPKLLGTYEQELHPSIAKFADRSYGAIVDIGCAEGYYAVGLARLFPGTKVFAFDIDQRATSALQSNSELNGITSIEIGGECTSETLIGLSQAHGPLLIISDCEGYEAKLFSNSGGQPKLRNALRTSDLIIECHDFINPVSTAMCFAMFSKTHSIENLYSGGRDPNLFPFLSNMTELYRWLAVCENRPCTMNWLVLQSRLLRL